MTAPQRREWAGPTRPPVPAEPVWPDLPPVDFTTLRAASARRLARREFERVDALYQSTAARVDEWLTEQRHQLAPEVPADDLVPAEKYVRAAQVSSRTLTIDLASFRRDLLVHRR